MAQPQAQMQQQAPQQVMSAAGSSDLVLAISAKHRVATAEIHRQTPTPLLVLLLRPLLRPCNSRP
eukprot:UN03170